MGMCAAARAPPLVLGEFCFMFLFVSFGGSDHGRMCIACNPVPGEWQLMAWVRWGDTANFAKEFVKAHELAAERGDPRLVLELKGALFTLVTYSAEQWTDYVITYGAAVSQLGMANITAILEDLITIGALQDISTDSERKYRLVERDALFNIIKTTDKTLRAKRKRDLNRGSLQVPVLLRDGSNCRYCSIEVNWKDHSSEYGGTFDHREPDKETTPENYVVCCRGCNQLRYELGEDAETELPLLEPPEVPIYDDFILMKLLKWRRITERCAVKLGIPNPLQTGRVEASTRQASTPPAIQVGRERKQFPQEPDESLSSRGRAASADSEIESNAGCGAGEITTKNPFTPSHPTASQAECEKQHDQTGADVHVSGAVHGADQHARKRRRRRKGRK